MMGMIHQLLLSKMGKAVAAISKERIRNIKHYNGVPTNSIKEVFNISGIDTSEADVISIGNYLIKK